MEVGGTWEPPEWEPLARRSVRLAPSSVRRSAGGARRIRSRNPVGTSGRILAPYEINGSAIGGVRPGGGTGLDRICWEPRRRTAAGTHPVCAPHPGPGDALHRGPGDVSDVAQAGHRADDAGMDAGVVPGARVRAPCRGSPRPRSGRACPARRQVEEEPMAGGDGRSRRRRPDIPRLRSRAAGENELGRGFLRPDQRCSDLHHPGRARAASSRGRARAPRRMVQVADVVTSSRRRSTTPLPRPRLRHPGRLSDRGRQSGRLRVHRRPSAARPGERRRGRRLGRGPLDPGR